MQSKMRLLFLREGLENYVVRKEYSFDLIKYCTQTPGEEKMKRLFPFFVLLLIFFVAACSSPTPTATQAPAQPAATEAPTQSGATEAPAAAGNQVIVTLADNTIEASTTNFQVGVPYTFVITNSGRHAHNFNINPPVSVAGSLDQALNSALLAVPQEQLGVGATATVDFTFPDSAAGQLLEFSCLIRRHYEDGMHVDITVTK
jgi:uncharacterized cupredoxin-like copper-binding protein